MMVKAGGEAVSLEAWEKAGNYSPGLPVVQAWRRCRLPVRLL